MFAIFAIIIAIIIYFLRGVGVASPADEQSADALATREVLIAPTPAQSAQQPAQQSAQQPAVIPIVPIVPTVTVAPKRARAKRGVTFASRAEIREFNVNDGDITGQYSKTIGGA